MAVAPDGSVYVADKGNNRIRKISLSGDVSTVTDSLLSPKSIAVDRSGSIYFLDDTARVLKVSVGSQPVTFAGSTDPGTADGRGTAAKFDAPAAIAVDSIGSVFVAEGKNGAVRKITSEGEVTTLKASWTSDITGIAVDDQGYLYVAEAGPGLGSAADEDVVWKRDQNNIAKWVAGRKRTYGDGNGLDARFFGPSELAVGPDGSVFVADTYNSRIRRINRQGDVTTFAGSGEWGDRDGSALQAQFSNPTGLVADALGNVYVSGSLSRRLSKVTQGGTVSTLSGGNLNASPLTFADGIGIDASGNILASSKFQVVRISPNGDVAVVAGDGSYGHLDGPATTARFSRPVDAAADALGNVWVCDGNRIRRISPNGEVSTIAGSATPGLKDGPASSALFNNPKSITVDVSGDVLVADTGNACIRKIVTSGEVTTLAGGAAFGFADGILLEARFGELLGMQWIAGEISLFRIRVAVEFE